MENKISSMLSISLIMLFLIITSCSNENKPEVVAEKFLTHLSKGEYEEAKLYATENTKTLLNFIKNNSSTTKKDDKSSEEKFEHVKTIINGDEAVCTFKKDSIEEKIPMKKVDGKWLVDLKKETLNKEPGKSQSSLFNNLNNDLFKISSTLDSTLNSIDSSLNK